MKNLFKEFDAVLKGRAVMENVKGLLDASSLLWRLEVMGVDVGDRWEIITEAMKHHIHNNRSPWYIV